MKYGIIAERLRKFFKNGGRKVVVRPIFYGCGFIDTSEGDVIFGDTLYEVKTVERTFRSSDVRQVLTYAALNSGSGQYSISRFGLFNPRRGNYCELDLDDVCVGISGRPAQELFSIVIETISSGDISR